MRKIFICSVILFLLLSCKKDDCVKDIKDEALVEVYFNKIVCDDGITPNENYTRIYKSEDEYFNDGSCNRQSIGIPIGFEGFILAQGVKVPYISQNVNTTTAYELDVNLLTDECEKIIFLEFNLKSVDTSILLNHLENVLVLIEDFDTTYTINFSHKIIPYIE